MDGFERQRDRDEVRRIAAWQHRDWNVGKLVCRLLLYAWMFALVLSQL